MSRPTVTPTGGAPSRVEEAVLGRPGEPRERERPRHTLLDAVTWELMVAGNHWLAVEDVAGRVARHGKARAGDAEVEVIAGRIRRLPALKRSPIITTGGMIRIWTLDTATPDGIDLPCAACRARFRTEGGQLAWLARRGYSIPRRCHRCRNRNDDRAAETVRAMAADLEREGQERRSHQPHHPPGVESTSAALEYEPGEGPGTPGGCVHGLPREICRTCSQRSRRSD